MRVLGVLIFLMSAWEGFPIRLCEQSNHACSLGHVKPWSGDMAAPGKCWRLGEHRCAIAHGHGVNRHSDGPKGCPHGRTPISLFLHNTVYLFKLILVMNSGKLREGLEARSYRREVITSYGTGSFTLPLLQLWQSLLREGFEHTLILMPKESDCRKMVAFDPRFGCTWSTDVMDDMVRTLSCTCRNHVLIVSHHKA